MNILQILNVQSFLFYLVLSGYILIKNPKSLLNRLCSAFIFCFVVWSFTLIFIQDPNRSKATVRLLYTFNSIGWCSFSSFYVWFILVFAEKTHLLKRKIFYAVIFSLPALFIYKQGQDLLLVDYINGPLGWSYVWGKNIWVLLFCVYYLVFMSMGLYYCFDIMRKAENVIKIKQAKIIFFTMIFSLAFGSATNLVLPMLNIYSVPNLATLGVTVWAFGIVYAIVKYKFLAITPAVAAEKIIFTMSECLILLDNNSRIVSVNKQVINLLGYTEAQLRSKPVDILFAGESLKNEQFYKLSVGEEIKNCDFIFETKNRENIMVLFSSSVLRGSAGDRIGTVCLVRDVTEYKKSEEQLKYRLEFEKLIANISASFINLPLQELDSGINKTLETIGRFVEVDRSYVSLFSKDLRTMDNTHEWHNDGVPSKMRGLQAIPTDEFHLLMGEFKQSKVLHIPCVDDLPDTSREKMEFQAEGIKSIFAVPMIYSGALVGFVGFDSVGEKKDWTKDTIALLKITGEIFTNAFQRKWNTEEKEKLNYQLIQSEKLATVGELAAGVAHELNTPLNVILAYQELLQKRHKEDATSQEYVGIAIEEIGQCRDLINDFMFYARPSDIKSIEKGSVDINETIHSALKLIALHKMQKIKVTLNIEENIPCIKGDQKQIMHLFINLINNAVQAMPGGGDLTVATKYIHCNGQDRESIVEFRVNDTGEGIPEENIKKVFNPFFTTKRPGKGTGLGLAICSRIIENHNGTIRTESKPGGGTVFIGEIPVK